MLRTYTVAELLHTYMENNAVFFYLETDMKDTRFPINMRADAIAMLQRSVVVFASKARICSTIPMGINIL